MMQVACLAEVQAVAVAVTLVGSGSLLFNKLKLQLSLMVYRANTEFTRIK